MISLRRLALTLVCLVGKGDVIFTNMNDADPGQRYGANGYTVQSAVPDRVMGYVSIAAPFSVSETSRLDNLLLALSGTGDPNFGTAGANVTLLSDWNGTPGMSLEQWVDVPAGVSGSDCCAVSFLISQSRPVLEVGKQYWVLVEPNPGLFTQPGAAFTAMRWRYNNTNDLTPYIGIGTTVGGGVTVYTPEQRFTDTLIRPAMEVRGTRVSSGPDPNPAPVPEGSNIASSLSALALALYAGKRRR